MGSRDPVLTFWKPQISRVRLKVETSNFARIRTAVSSNEENAKLGQKGSCGGHVTQFRNFGNPLISRLRLKLETSNFARIRMAVSSNVETAKLGQNRSCGVT